LCHLLVICSTFSQPAHFAIGFPHPIELGIVAIGITLLMIVSGFMFPFGEPR
jgi:ribose/xylose/arabinose/galactoside ABC-type transport system permease subunit